MRKEGRLILGLARILGLRRLRATVLDPAIADMQHEIAEAGSTKERTAALIRGYASILTGCAHYAALGPSRHLRENWANSRAAGPQLLRRALPIAILVGILGATALMMDAPAVAWERGTLVVALLIPIALVNSIPLTLSLGVGWSLARDRSSRGPVLGIGVAGALLMFAAFDLTVPQASEGYRAGIVAPQQTYVKGSREMRFLELQAAAEGWPHGLYHRSPQMCWCAAGRSNPFLIEWHKRLAAPALCISFVLLAAALSRFQRRAVVLVGLVLAMRTSAEVLMRAEALVRDGNLPVWAAVWSAQLVPCLLALGLHLLAEFNSRDRTGPEPGLAPA